MAGSRSERLRRLRESMFDFGVTHALITKPEDVAYLTGFHGGDSFLIVPLERRGRPVVVSDSRYEEELREVVSGVRIHLRRSGIIEETAEELRAAGAQRIGIQAEHLTVLQRRKLGRLMGIRKLVDTSGVVATLRLHKDADELKSIRKAIRIQQEALLATLDEIEPGMTELQVAAVLEMHMKSRGSSRPGFDTIVAAGATSSMPHYRPRARKLTRGKPLLIDWGAVAAGYHGDMTRVIVFGRWPAKIREIYRVVLEAHERAASMLRPGVTTREVDAAARDHIAEAGYGDFFGHGLGHGLGLEGHEDPRLAAAAPPRPLEEGMVLTIEPGIYLPGVGGIRLEDDYVITARGARNLCSLPKDMDWATR